MGTRFDTLIRACLQEMAESPHPVTGVTTAAGTVATLVDSNDLKETGVNADDTRYVGDWLRVWDSGTPSVENIRKIKTYAPSTGTLAPESDFTAAPGTSKTYEIHHKLHPDKLKQAICDALAELRYQEILPLTLVADGDMVGTVVATYWGNSNATPAYDTAKVLFGTHALSVAAIAANGYAYPKTNLAVTPGEWLIVWAPVYGDQKQAELVLYDVTHSAEIETARHDEEGWGLLWFTAEVPADCYEVRPHLRTKTNGGTTYWDHVGILKCNQRVYDSPGWLSKRQDVIKVVSFPRGSGLISDNADNAYGLWAYGPQHEHLSEMIYAHRGVVPLRLELGRYPDDALFVVGKRRYPALSDDADETQADATLVKAGALALAYRRLGPEYAGQAKSWAKLFNELRPAEEPALTVRQVSCWRR
jgi:hypothetical protein